MAPSPGGLAVVLLNQRLCDCFLSYGEVTTEMAMLLAFVLFGAVLSRVLDTVSIGPALILAVLVIFAIRPGGLGLGLARARMSWEAHAFVSWFGPRGLNSLLLALLAVQAAIPNSELLLATVGVVVIASIVVHGGSATPASSWYGRRVAAETLLEEREGTAAGLFHHEAGQAPRITAEDLDRLLKSGPPPLVLDVRSRSSYEKSKDQVPGSIRVRPDHVGEWAATGPKANTIVAYCA